MNRIAIVGIGLQLPGANNKEQYWRRLQEGHDLSTVVDASRWGINPESIHSAQPKPDKVRCLRGYFVSPEKTSRHNLKVDLPIDELGPLYSLPVEAASQALSEVRQISLADTGLILASIALPTDDTVSLTEKTLGRDFVRRLHAKCQEGPLRRILPLLANDPSFGPLPKFKRLDTVSLPGGLTAAALGLGAGAFTLDAACASSLTAVKLACQVLLNGQAEAMLAGGLSHPSCLFTQMGFSALHALSPQGQCRPFDADADGLMVGEGCGMVLLKRLEDAVRDNDHIYAVIKACGQSNDLDGSLLAPAVEGQLRAMQRAYSQAELSPLDIDLIECHGTGTPVGDSVEFSSLCKLWSNLETPWTPGQCALTSVKAMIGHLLTAAGAAGLIRVLLCMQHETITKQPNFSSPGVPIENSPFRIPTELGPWPRRDSQTPRRAAVSGFGFGGINAHVIVEEYLPEVNPAKALSAAQTVKYRNNPQDPIAIVGMAAHVGNLKDLQQFQYAVLNGRSALAECPADRCRHIDEDESHRYPQSEIPGAYIEGFDMPVGPFRIPPTDMAAILPQQALMLTVAAAAMQHAGLTLREKREKAAAIIGIALDMQSSDFSLRWSLQNKVQAWSKELGLSQQDAEEWLAQLRQQACPALDSVRTVGALGSITASRVAREFGFGGASYTVSDDTASGLTALEIACDALQQGELDLALVGAVDLGGDVRLQMSRRQLSAQPKPLDKDADGTAVGEGAVAVVLMRLSQAKAQGHRIISIIRGFGKAGGGLDESCSNSDNYCEALGRAYKSSKVAPASISYLETHGSGVQAEDACELQAIANFFGENPQSLALGSLAPIVGQTKALAGLCAVVKASLCLHTQILPPLAGFTCLPPVVGLDPDTSVIHVPIQPSYWIRNRQQGPRRAGVSAMTHSGQFVHVVLEEGSGQPQMQPLGAEQTAIFPLFGQDTQQLVGQLEQLETFVSQADWRPRSPISPLAQSWWQLVRQQQSQRLNLTIVASFFDDLQHKILKANKHLQERSGEVSDKYGVYYSPTPEANLGKAAFVYPGSGAHFLGMGRELAARFPNLMHNLDQENLRLADQFMVRWCQPYLSNWERGWKTKAQQILSSDTHKMMFSQVSFGVLGTEILKYLGFQAQAAIGYSLGESTAFFANGAWPNRDEMLDRMEHTDLFKDKLSGRYLAARQAWNVPNDVPFNWMTAMIPLPSSKVVEALQRIRHARLLIVNTDDECVVGGTAEAITALTSTLNVDGIMIHGVDAVHCDVLAPVAQEYRSIHTMITKKIPNFDFYSGQKARAYEVSPEACADSIVSHGVKGFDYTKTIRQAYDDGIRVFLEVGPGGSCTRMIGKILKDKPHFAFSLSMRGRSELVSLMHLLASSLAHGLRPELDKLYNQPQPAASDLPSVHIQLGAPAFAPTLPALRDCDKSPVEPARPLVTGSSGASASSINSAKTVSKPAPVPEIAKPYSGAETSGKPAASPTSDAALQSLNLGGNASGAVAQKAVQSAIAPMANTGGAELIAAMQRNTQASARVHEAWLSFASHGIEAISQLLTNQTNLLQSYCEGQYHLIDSNVVATTMSRIDSAAPAISHPTAVAPTSAGTAPINAHIPTSEESANQAALSALSTHMLSGNLTSTTGGYVHGYKPCLAPPDLPIWLNREQCLQFARGRISQVLGDQFAEIDNYATRVRLPDEPLMLVDRILRIEGEPLSLGKGRLITEHDIVPGIWYLDGGRAPVFLSVEAGQADLFLSSWLGIDLQTKGQRVYRLLDATVIFHRGLPQPGETVRYDIRIDRFVRQGDTWIFFFEYEATIAGQLFLTMRNGCAGFFTHKEIRDNRGLVLTDYDTAPKQGHDHAALHNLVNLPAASYSEKQVEALRLGNLTDCFGPAFENLPINDPVRLPGGLLRLIHRVPLCDPNGGRWSLGIVRAEADIHPDDWYLTCHFIDDMVMPGTLMYECCAHALRFLLTSMGWVDENEQIAYEPVVGVEAALKCRGPVLQSTKTVVYQVEIKEIGSNPEPYVIADALMFADGKRIVGFQNISMQMTGTTCDKLQTLWQQKANQLSAATLTPVNSPADFPADLQPGQKPEAAVAAQSSQGAKTPALYSRNSLLQYATGLPSLAFGPHFSQFDSRFIARLPGPPYQFIDRITRVDHPFMKMEPGGWVEAEYDVPVDAWYFRANRQATMPFCVLLEIPLQVCGWVSAYSGSSALSPTKLQYRNLGGSAILHSEIFPDCGTLEIKVRMTKASQAGGLIVQEFDFWMGQQKRTIYEGYTTFGYFTPQSLGQQVGVRDAAKRFWDSTTQQSLTEMAIPQEHPYTPDDPEVTSSSLACMPGKALLMVDNLSWYPQGGHAGLGFVRGTYQVSKDSWFFKAHFFQDPVVPGSLGLESFLQLLKAAALIIWPELADSHRFEAILTGETHEWVYRGQVVPNNKLVTVEVDITERRQGTEPVLLANGFLKADGITIYEMKDFGIRLTRP